MKKKQDSALDYVNTHRELVEQCKTGNRQAQFTLYKQYSKAMYNTCLRMLNDTADAEDALQMAFVQVFRKIDSFRYESSIGAWIKRIVINNCINVIKKRKMDFAEWDDKYNARIDETEAPLDRSAQVQDIKRAMTKLSTGYRTVFNMYALEGYDHQEIAQVLGISEATSKSQYSRARKKIKAILAQ